MQFRESNYDYQTNCCFLFRLQNQASEHPPNYLNN